MLELWNKVVGWLPLAGASAHSDESVAAAASRRTEDYRRLGTAGIRALAAELATLKADRARHDVALAAFIVAVERVLGWTPFQVQLQAAVAMARGCAVEMQTGEGKTLAAAAAAAALALHGRRVHLATVNAYLARRDFEQFSPVLRSLGISIGLVHEGQTVGDKRRAYACSVVYGTGYEFGFDYLREQMRLLARRSPRLGDRYRRRFIADFGDEPLQSPLDCAIVDELDSVLLDEACVPLILSEPSFDVTPDVAWIARAEEVALALRADRDYLVDPIRRTLALTAHGHQAIEAAFPRDCAGRLLRPWRQYVEHALFAQAMLRRDVDYVVADRRLWLVDLTTGRVFDDRRWPEGLHQAVEYKERLRFSSPASCAARITRQRFFKLYRMLCGTSGTLVEAADELRQSYGLRCVIVPPRLPSRRVELPTRYFRDGASRERSVLAEVISLHRLGRPVLVGCRTIDASRAISQAFRFAGLPHRLLNGVQTEDEALIVAQAGRTGAVTIATNLAGRGTDIRLDEASRIAGGLHVVGIERHESARIDRQLLGRAARQGDPGSGRFFVAATDGLFHGFPAIADRMARRAEADGEIRADCAAETERCRDVVEAAARFRRRETTAADGRLDDLLAALANPE